MMVNYMGHVIPLCHFLMTGRKEGLYVAGLECLQSRIPDFNPTHAIADFEQAIKNALIRVFPEIDVRGCPFHFGQAVVKKLKSVGLQTEFLNVQAVKK